MKLSKREKVLRYLYQNDNSQYINLEKPFKVNDEKDREIIRFILNDLNQNGYVDIKSNNSSQQLIDSLAIIEKYKNGNPYLQKYSKKKYQEDPSWRKDIPSVIREKVTITKGDTIDEVYSKSKELLNSIKDSDTNSIRNWLMYRS
jgi:hypothetical protein